MGILRIGKMFFFREGVLVSNIRSVNRVNLDGF